MATTTTNTTTFKDVGTGFLGLLEGVFVGGRDVVISAGKNAAGNAANNQAIADANKAAPSLIDKQLTMQAEKDAAQRQMIMYAGAGAAGFIVLIVIVMLIIKKSKK